MIRLGLTTEPRWLDLGVGVRVQVRPLTTAIMESARQKANGEVSGLRAARDKIKAVGGDVVDLPQLDDPAVEAGELLARLVRALAQYSVMSWEGVCDDAGAPLAPTPALIAELMDVPSMSKAFFDQYAETITERVREKNA